MNNVDATVVTAYGRLDRAALTQAQRTYDTSVLLSVVEELDRIVGRARGPDGLRESLLRLHGMAHAVINGAALTVPANEESLPASALDATAEILRTISMLEGWVKMIEPLESLQPRS